MIKSAMLVLMSLFMFACMATFYAELKMPVYFHGKTELDLFPDKKVAELARAAARGKIKQIDQLFQDGVDVNAVGERNLTPLMWALCKRNRKGFRRLLEQGANANIQLDSDTSVVSWAATASDPYYLECALKYGGDPNLIKPNIKTTPLFDAVLAGNKAHIQLLLDSGADINHQQAQGQTALMKAVVVLEYGIVYYLLEQGADPYIKDRWGFTLVRSIERHNMLDPKSEVGKWRIKVIRKLQEMGIHVNESLPEQTKTPLIHHYLIR